MRKSLGEKRKEISAEQIDEITRLYGDFAENERGEDLPERGVRLPAHHRRAAAAAALGGDARRSSGSPRRRQWAKLQRRDRSDLRSRSARPSRARRRPTETQSLAKELGGRPQGHREGALGRARGARPRGPDHHEPEGRAGARPRPARQRERPAARRSRSRGRPTRPSGSRARVPDRRRGLHGGRGAARTSPTPGSTTTRRRSATRSRSPATSTSTCRRDRSPRSTPRSRRWRPRSRSCCARSRSDASASVVCANRHRALRVSTRRSTWRTSSARDVEGGDSRRSTRSTELYFESSGRTITSIAPDDMLVPRRTW